MCVVARSVLPSGDTLATVRTDVTRITGAVSCPWKRRPLSVTSTRMETSSQVAPSTTVSRLLTLSTVAHAVSSDEKTICVTELSASSAKVATDVPSLKETVSLKKSCEDLQRNQLCQM